MLYFPFLSFVSSYRFVACLRPELYTRSGASTFARLLSASSDSTSKHTDIQNFHVSNVYKSSGPGKQSAIHNCRAPVVNTAKGSTLFSCCSRPECGQPTRCLQKVCLHTMGRAAVIAKARELLDDSHHCVGRLVVG